MGYIPPLNTPGPVDNDDARSHKMGYLKNVVLEMLRPIIDAHGGFVLNLQGEYHFFIPEIALIIQDALEVSW